MEYPNGLKFQLRCLGYLWFFRQTYPGNLRAVLAIYALRRAIYFAMVWGGWAFAVFLLAAVLRPIWVSQGATSFHAFDAFTLFLMPIIIIGIGRFGGDRTHIKWRKSRRRAILFIRSQRRAQSAAGPSGGAIFSAGRIH